MAERFRNFVNKRRTRSIEPDNELFQASVPYQAVQSTNRPPIFLYQSLAKHGRDSRSNAEGINALPLRSLSYEACSPGKAPLIGTVPQKGNGPIKLQGTRRLSSGDQVTTQHDTQDLREGGYVVGRSTRQSSIDQRCSPVVITKDSSLSPGFQSFIQSNPTSPRVTTPSASKTWPSSPVVSISNRSTQRHSATNKENIGTGRVSPYHKANPRHSHESLSGLQSPSSHVSSSHESMRSVHNSTDNNATLKALRKAEFTRLAELYGSDAAAARNIAHMDSARLRAMNSPNAFGAPAYSPIILEPLPPPPVEHPESDPRRNSDSSITDCCCESLSGSCSPQRTSYVSSCADSSIMTGQTSLEDEATTTREEIRSVVAQMRHTYLSAIENQTASMPKSKVRRRTRRSKTKPSKAASEADDKPRSMQNSRQTWHPSETHRDVTNKRRVNSHPVGRPGGTLSPIPASPDKNEPSGLGLHRADSATLGGLMGEVNRESIRARKQSRSEVSDAMARPTTPCEQMQRSEPEWQTQKTNDLGGCSSNEAFATPAKQWTDNTLKPVFGLSTELVATPAVDIDTLFADDLWSSDTQMSSFSGSEFSLQPISSNDSFTHTTSILPQITPKKQTSRIPSIPESPEYTHLAKNTRPEDNFI